MFRDKSFVRAAYEKGAQCPTALRHQGREFRDAGFQIPLFNHLLNPRRELVGFNFTQADALTESLVVSHCENVFSTPDDPGALDFILAEPFGQPFDNNTSQALAANVLADGRGDHILLVPDFDEWGELWTRLGFTLQTENGPERL